MRIGVENGFGESGKQRIEDKAPKSKPGSIAPRFATLPFAFRVALGFSFFGVGCNIWAARLRPLSRGRFASLSRALRSIVAPIAPFSFGLTVVMERNPELWIMFLMSSRIKCGVSGANVLWERTAADFTPHYPKTLLLSGDRLVGELDAR